MMTPIEYARHEFLAACGAVDALRKSQLHVALKQDGGYSWQQYLRQVQIAVARKEEAFHHLRLLQGRAAEPLKRPIKLR
jgi:hypothetical protein